MANLLFILTVSCAIFGWWQVGSRLIRNLPVIPQASSRNVPWGLLDLLFILLLFLVVSSALTLIASSLGFVDLERLTIDDDSDPELSRSALTSQIALFGVSSLATWCGGILFLVARHRLTWIDLGLGRPKASDFQLGIVGGATLIVPTFAIQSAVTFVIEQVATEWQPTKHPLIELLQDDPSPGLFVMAGIFAVVVAPVTEEFLFRVWLQGWFENCTQYFVRSRRNATPESSPNSSHSEHLLMGRGLKLEEPLQTIGAALDAASSETTPPDGVAQSDGVATPAVERPSIWPVLISSTLFSAAHVGNGPDPIPLFVLALGLGYIYQRTRRVLPCIIVHMMCNGISLAALWEMLHRP